jgi:glycosyltransferase involved in cell wall biosynthesis
MNVPQVLIVSGDYFGLRMAGPAIRAWELARVLGRQQPVTLAVPNKPALADEGFSVVSYDEALLRRLVAEHNVVLVQGAVLRAYPFLRDLASYLVADLYDPYPLETLVQGAGEGQGTERRARHFQARLATLTAQLAVADFFLCASERQRDFWLGMLLASGRLTPAAYDQDHTLRRLIDLVPFGLPETPPVHSRPVLKGIWPGIESDDRVILWGGGIHEWLDPATPVRAMALVARQEPRARLFFMGLRHPNPDVLPARATEEAIRLSKNLGLYDRHVFFNPGWVPYEERANYLLEADLGVNAHRDHLEARLAFRTRLVDYLWAGLPVVTTAGDHLGDLVETHGLGCTVPVGDAEAMAAAILELLAQPDLRERYASTFRQVAAEYTWQRVAAPLAVYCRQPWRAADRAAGVPPSLLATPGSAIPPPPSRSLVAKAAYSLRHEGPAMFWRRVRAYLGWMRTR